MGLFDNLINKKDNSALGIDIGSSSIKVVQLRKKGSKAILDTYGELSLGPYANVVIGQSTNLGIDKISEALNDLLKEKEVAITAKNCGISIPFKASLLSILSLPDVGEKELSTMVPIEARKYIPVPISEVVIDWTVIPDLKTEDEIDNINGLKKKNILLVAIHNNVIKQYKDVFSKTPLVPKFFEIEIFSCIRAVLDRAEEPVMIFDMGSSSTKLYLINRGIIESSHTINHGSQEITANIARNLAIPMEQAEITKRFVGIGKTSNGTDLTGTVSVIADNIFSEANRFLFDYQRKNNRNIKSVILIGGGSALKGFNALASNNFKVDVISGNPFEKVEIPAFLQNILLETGPQFAVATGLALRCLQEI